jgi:hypothetical protein
MTAKKHIEVEAMSGMTRKQVRMTNGLANMLIGKHGMCLDCAIKFAVALVWGQDRADNNPAHAGPLCSSACGGALVEFFEETLGVKGEPVSADELPWLAH